MENNRFGKNKERSFDRKGGRKNFGSTGFSSNEGKRENRDERGSDRKFGSSRKSFSKDNRSDRDSFSRDRKPGRSFSSREGGYSRDSRSEEGRSYSNDRRSERSSYSNNRNSNDRNSSDRNSSDRRSYSNDRNSSDRRSYSNDRRSSSNDRRSYADDRGSERNSFSNERRSGKRPFSNDRKDDRNSFSKDRRGGRDDRNYSRESSGYSSYRNDRGDKNDRFDKRDRNERSERGERGGYRENREERSFDKKDRYSDRGRGKDSRSYDREERSSDRRGKSDWSEKRGKISIRRKDAETEKTFKADRDTLQKSHYSKKKQMEHRLKNPHLEESFRLNRYISNSGVCSRREADKLIGEGRITVNGKVVTEVGTKVKFTDTVKADGKALNPERKVYVLLNKPKDFVTTVADEMNRKTVMDLIKDACKERIYPVGRLDRMTSGLLLFTNDGDLAKKLTHPKYGKKKIYHAFLDKDLTKNDLMTIADGFELEDGFIQADEISYVDNIKNQVGIEIHSGKNRIVRRIFEHFGYNVEKLDRVYFAGLTKKNLPRGKWRMLTDKEVTMLKSY